MEEPQEVGGAGLHEEAGGNQTGFGRTEISTMKWQCSKEQDWSSSWEEFGKEV